MTVSEYEGSLGEKFITSIKRVGDVCYLEVENEYEHVCFSVPCRDAIDIIKEIKQIIDEKREGFGGSNDDS